MHRMRVQALALMAMVAATGARAEYLLDSPSTWPLFSRLDVLATTVDSEGAVLGSLAAGGEVADGLYVGPHAAVIFSSIETANGDIDAGDFLQLGGRIDWLIERTAWSDIGAHLVVAGLMVDASQGGRHEEDTALMLQPGVDISVHLWPGAEFGATASYRWVGDMAAAGFGDADLSGFQMGAFMRFTTIWE